MSGDVSKIEDVLRPFLPTQIQAIRVFIARLEEAGLSLADFSTHHQRISEEQVRQVEQDQIRHSITQARLGKKVQGKIKCSKCGADARFFPVNNKPSTMIGDGYTRAIQCTNARCLHTAYTKD